MAWIKGELIQTKENDPNPRMALPDHSGLHCGEGLEIKLKGRWRRGRVEFSTRLGWYWTDNSSNHPLRPGQEARVWDGLYWPPVKTGR